MHSSYHKLLVTNQCAISLLVKIWKHLDSLVLADPEYNKPGKIDLILGVGIFVEVIRHGRQPGPRDTPTALDTAFGWVLAGSAGAQTDSALVSSHFTSVMTGDDLLSVLGCRGESSG